MRKIYLLLFCLAGVFGRLDAQETLSLVLKQPDGAIRQWTLGSISRIAFEGTKMLVNSKDGSVASLELSIINKLYFSDGSSDIKGVQNGLTTIASLKQTAEVLTFSCVEGAVIEVYNANGAKVFGGVTRSGENSISLSNFARGIYVLKVDNQIIKFVKP